MPTLDNGLDLQVKMLVQNQFCYTNLVYYPQAMSMAIPLQDAVDDWWTQISAEWLDIVTTSSLVVSVKGTLRGYPFSGRTYTRPVNQPGTIVGDTLPAWVTASFRKWPDDASINPPTAPLFKPGRISISGIPESAQVDGTPTPSYFATVSAFCTGLKQFAVTSIAETLQMVMDREVTDPLGFARVKVDDIDLHRIGSQLTRKN